MKKLLVLAAAILISTAAFAGTTSTTTKTNNTGAYINANGGVNIIGNSDSNYNTGWNTGIAVGYKFNQHLRLEGAFNYIRNNATETDIGESMTGHTNQYLFMVNGYYDFGNFSGLIPYVGAGIGLNHGTTSIETSGVFSGSFAANNNDFTAQTIAGFNCYISKNVAVGISYHFNPVFDSGETMYNNLINLSLTYNF